ncbi:hypothetical protein C8D83_101434 [Halothiobacillus neapolitanus]|nr:hypothetical protein C8D83_101434 [Halothiobacillus neapolitanus]
MSTPINCQNRQLQRITIIGSLAKQRTEMPSSRRDQTTELNEDFIKHKESRTEDMTRISINNMSKYVLLPMRTIKTMRNNLGGNCVAKI